MGKAQLSQPPQLRKLRFNFYFETLRKLRSGIIKAFKICCAFNFFFRVKVQLYTLNLILLHFHRYIDKFRACLANYLLFFNLKLQKTQYLHCVVKLRLQKLGCALT